WDWARRHVYFRDSFITAPEMAHHDQSLHGGDDLVRSVLRRDVSPAPSRQAVRVFLAAAVSRHDVSFAAISQPARLGRLRRQHLFSRLIDVLVSRRDARPGDRSRQAENEMEKNHLWHE